MEMQNEMDTGVVENSTDDIADLYLRGDVARDLDFYRMRENVASLCVSEEGREILGRRECSSDVKLIEHWKTLGREWNRYQHSNHGQCLFGWPAVGQFFSLLGIDGANLTQDEIYALGIFCNNASKVKNGISSAADDINLHALPELADRIPDMKAPGDRIFSVIDSSGELRDLPQLRAARARIVSLQKEIEAAIRRYTSDPNLSAALQSNVPAYRQDRELLAVRADHRGDIRE